MSDFQRISLREAIESTRTALSAVESAITRAPDIRGSRTGDQLDEAANELAAALTALQTADRIIQTKATALPEAPTGP